MGQDVSSPVGIENLQNCSLSPADISIPISLRPVLPFLEEAQRNLCNARSATANPPVSLSRKRVAIACINHAFTLITILNLEWDADGRACLKTFQNIRDSLSIELGIPQSANVGLLEEYDAKKIALPSYEIIVAEADKALALADLQLKEGFRFDAQLNFHTACVYYRVMECLVPSLTAVVHKRLQYAAEKSRFCSTLSLNFVKEHFEGESCSGVYEVHGSNKLGKGSYGSVYLATHRLTGDERAVKVMNVDRVTSYYLRKLHTEISILKCVDHPNIIKLQDVFFGKRSVYLVTDLCKGGELFELLNAGKNEGFVFREDRASQLMRDMLGAVHYLHSKGILHRDLKLENFLFEEKNCNSPLVLIDFGLSKHFDPADKLTHRVGSCYYTAPEVLTGSYDFKCDTWSLGVLCYMLLSGSPPFNGKTVEAVYEATLTQDPAFPDRKFRFLSLTCLDFMKKLLVKDPTQRMSTGQALNHPFITGQTSPVPFIALHTAPQPTTPASWGMRNIITLSQKLSGKANSQLDVELDVTALCVTDEEKVLSPSGSSTKSGSSSSSSCSSSSSLSAAAAARILDSILLYLRADSLTKLALEIVTHTLSSDQMHQLRLEFQFMDKGNQGAVKLSDMQDVLEQAQGQSGISSRYDIDLHHAFRVMCVGHIRTHSPLLLSENYYSSLNGYENHTEILRSRFGEMAASTSLCGAEMCSGRGRERGSDKSSGVGSGCNSTSGSKKHDVSHYNSNSTYISAYNSTHSITNSNASSTNSIVASQYFTSTITQSSSSKYRCSSSSTPDSPVPVPLLSDSCSSSRRRVMNFREYVAAAMVQRVAVAEERIILAFEALDFENKGYLSGAAMHKALGGDLTAERGDHMIYTSAVMQSNRDLSPLSSKDRSKTDDSNSNSNTTNNSASNSNNNSTRSSGSHNGDVEEVHVRGCDDEMKLKGAKDREKEKEKESFDKGMQMTLAAFLTNWRLNLTATVPANKHASLRDIDLTVTSTCNSGTATPAATPSPREAINISRRDSQTTCETTSQQTSHTNSRRNSGASFGLWSRRNSDTEGRRDTDPQMFPDVPAATAASAESLAQKKYALSHLQVHHHLKTPRIKQDSEPVSATNK